VSRRGWLIGLTAGVLVLVVVMSVAASIFNANLLGWPAWIGLPLGALAVVAGGFGGRVLDVLSDWPLAAVARSLERDKILKSIAGYGIRVSDSADRITLNIHPALPLPRDAPSGLSDEFPLYVPRDIDADVRTWIRTRARGGCLVLLVGAAAAGKTRLLAEALLAEVPDWQLLRPSSQQLNAAAEAGTDLSRSVLWLDELQTFFEREPLRAATLKALLAGRHGPVMLAATIRSDERERLLGRTARASRELDVNANEILRMPNLWSGWMGGTDRAAWFVVEGQLTAAEKARASALSSSDPRLAVALRDARAGDLTATLACETALVRRWRDGGDPEGQAVVTAAVVARRCGHPEPIPEDLLKSVALAWLSGQGTAPDNPRWLPHALKWAQDPIMGAGVISAIRPVRTMPGIIDGYQISDILLQNSLDADHPDVKRLLDDDAIWHLVLTHASQPAIAEIGLSAYNAEKLEVAQAAWKAEADRGDAGAARRLGVLYWDLGQEAADEWLRRAVDLGSTEAVITLAHWLYHYGRAPEAEQILAAPANQGYPRAMLTLGFVLGGRGDTDGAERWTRKAAEAGNRVAMANLGYRLSKRDADDEAEEWNLRSAQMGFPGGMENLGNLYIKRGDRETAIKWYRRGAEKGWADVKVNPRRFRPWPGEASDDGISDAILKLADLLYDEGQETEAMEWYTRGAELGDARSGLALAANADKSNDQAAADELLRQAAAHAQSNLVRNHMSLRFAYGESAVRRHTSIMRSYADRLARYGDVAEAREWYQSAVDFGDYSAGNALPRLD
jgi:Tetratricopeptide repeat